VISGKVTKSGTRTGVAGVTITFSGSIGTAITDVGGNYCMSVPYKWSGTATASFGSGGFAKPTILYRSLTSARTGQNYIWSPPPMISGKVTKSGTSKGVAGVTITASNGGATTITDASGYYALEVPYNWTGKVTPSWAGSGTFSPGSKAFTVKVTANKAGQNFTWKAPVASIEQ